MKQEKRIYDCAVIGGGAAGLMAAIQTARSGLDTIIIEHSRRIGSKILQTGNGKCNFTNRYMDASCFQNEQRDCVMAVINQFDEKAAIAFFESIGIFHRERSGYVYPHSDTAASVQNALRMEAEHLGVRVSTEFETKEIKRQENCYGIISDSYTYYARTVLLATGSMAAPKSGSDGSGYRLAKKLGHCVNKPLPALVQLVCANKECRLMTGVRNQGRAELFIEDTFVAAETGEIQFTDYGISGIPVFQLSRYAVKALDQGKKAAVRIDLLPDCSAAWIEKMCEQGLEKNGYRTVEQFFEGLLNRKLVAAMAQSLKISTSKPVAQLRSKDLLRLAGTFKHCEFQITGFQDYDHAQICQGGVPLEEVYADSMMSVKKRGLFFAGELLDVDGKCGGYNLQWAWSSGAVAARGIKTYIEQEKGKDDNASD